VPVGRVVAQKKAKFQKWQAEGSIEAPKPPAKVCSYFETPNYCFEFTKRVGEPTGLSSGRYGTRGEMSERRTWHLLGIKVGQKCYLQGIEDYRGARCGGVDL